MAAHDPVPDDPDPAVHDRRQLMRASLLTGGAMAVWGLGGPFLRMLEAPAFGDQAHDVQMLQTSVALENVAVAAYDAASALPFVGGEGANPTLKAFVATTRNQHADHAAAFSAALAKLGGKAQPNPDPVLAETVSKAKPALTDVGKVVELAITLESTASQTYQSYLASLADANAKMVTASIMGVDAQHLAVLLAVQALIKAGRVDLVNLDPGNVGGLPDTIGGAGFPEPFQKTELARPAAEGAIS